MRKDSITKRAFKLYSSYNPKYFPVKFFQILFDNFAPYFTLWMSSEIVTALYSKADKQSVYILIAITLLGNLLVRIISAVLKRAVDTQLQILGINECVAFNTKTLSLDYDKPLAGFDETAYAAYPIRGSMALTERGQKVLELMEYQGLT